MRSCDDNIITHVTGHNLNNYGNISNGACNYKVNLENEFLTKQTKKVLTQDLSDTEKVKLLSLLYNI